MFGNMLYKEFKLTNPGVYIFTFITPLLVFASNWPAMTPYIYTVMTTYLMFVYAVQNKDLEYTVTLPIRKRDVVKARVLWLCVIQLVTIVLGAVAAYFKYTTNFIAQEAFIPFYSVGSFGYLFVVLGISDLFFLAFAYKKTDTKYLWQFLCDIILAFVLIIPHWILCDNNDIYDKFMNSYDFDSSIRQIPILIVGILIWFGLHVLAYKIAAKSFEKVDM